MNQAMNDIRNNRFDGGQFTMPANNTNFTQNPDNYKGTAQKSVQNNKKQETFQNQ